MKALGASEEAIEATKKSIQRAEDFEIFEDIVQSVTVFKRMGTQWQFAGMKGMPVGLNYASLPVVMRRCKVKREDFDQVFDDVQVMEEEALMVFVERFK